MLPILVALKVCLYFSFLVGQMPDFSWNPGEREFNSCVCKVELENEASESPVTLLTTKILRRSRDTGDVSVACEVRWMFIFYSASLDGKHNLITIKTR